MEQNIQSLNNLSVFDRFKECYSFLSRHFSEKGIHNILLSALAPTRYREEDELIARLIKADFFNTVITTNIDTLLEDACVLQGMKEPIDYQVISCESDDSTALGQGSSRCGQIVKIFGDRISLKYHTVGNEFDLEADQPLKKFLVSELAKEIIVLGYDPIWDRPIEQAFQGAGGMLWYVNEEQPVKNTYLAHVLNQRAGKFLVGPQGNYSSFLRALYDLIGEGASRELETGLSPPLAQSQNPTRKKAFISYSHKDKKYLERLRIHLMGYLLAGSEKDALDIRDDVWYDAKIPPGADWKEEIRKALAYAKVAVLLVNADFLGSDFIREYELPTLLEAAQAGEVQILSVLLGPCAFAYTPLSRYQVMNPASEPLMGMKTTAQEVVWAKLAEEIFTILNSQK